MRTRQITVIAAVVVGTSQVAHADQCPFSYNKIDASDLSGLETGDFFGTCVTSLCDLNGDGIDEVAVGAIGDDDIATNSGAVWLLRVDDVDPVQVVHKISGPPDLPPGALEARDLFGSSVTPLGDIDGNSTCDMAVGAQLDDDGGIDQGAIWILCLGPAGVVMSSEKISETHGLGDILDSGDALGGSLASADVNGDGRKELIAGMFGDDTGGEDRGAVLILFLNANGTFHHLEKIAHGVGGLVLSDRDKLGVSVATLGDLDGDGPSTVAVAAGAQGTDSAKGAVWIFFLSNTGTLLDSQRISEGQGGLSASLDTSDEFGRGVGSLGDLNRDGVPELGVGAVNDDDGPGIDRGAFYVLSLAPDGTVVGERKISDQGNAFQGNLSDSDNFGVAIALLDDLDGDGRAEVACCAHQDDEGMGGVDQGSMYVLMLDRTLPTTLDSVDEAIHFEFDLVNLHTSSIDGLAFANPRFIDQDSVADTSIVFLGANVFDASPISLPGTPPDRWVRLNQDSQDPQYQKETWWFFPAVSSSQSLPGLGLTISDPGEGCNSESALLVDYSLTSGAATVRCGTIRLPCDIPVLTALPEYRPSDAGQPSSMRNYPNPFGPSTTIEYQLEVAGVATIEIYDVTGRLVRRLECGAQQPGAGRAQWDGTNTDRSPAADGVYFYKLVTECGESSRAKRLVLLR